tara:strand:+ start:1509 stop:1805 length:297 start_codon:yes stop_codon:yes gene_type:complete
MVGVVIVEAISVRNKVYIYAVGFVDDKGARALRVISDLELGLDILQRKNVGYSVWVKPDIAIVLDVGLLVGGEITTVTVDCHGVVCFPYMGDELAVAK